MAKCLINGTNDNSKNGRAIQILNFLVDKGLTPKQACAICGNAYVETNRDYDPKSINTNDCNKTKTECGPSYGLFQWHDVCTKKKPDGSWDESSCSGRFTKLKNYCNSNSLDYRTIKGQLSFLWHENSANFTTAFKAKTNESMSSLVSWWEQNWEVCGGCNHNDRLAEANRLADLYNQMNKTECNVDTSDVSSATSGNFSCDESVEYDTTVDLSVDTPTESSTNSDGSVSATPTVNVKPLFVGDSFAVSILKEMPYLRNMAQPLMSNGWRMDTIAQKVMQYMSNPNNQPKGVVLCCGYDTKFVNDSTWSIYQDSAIKLVMNYLRGILKACRGCRVLIVEDLYPYNSGCRNDYGYTAVAQLNSAISRLAEEGDSADFAKFVLSTQSKEELKKHTQCVNGKNKATYKSDGFRIIGRSLVSAFKQL